MSCPLHGGVDAPSTAPARDGFLLVILILNSAFISNTTRCCARVASNPALAGELVLPFSLMVRTSVAVIGFYIPQLGKINIPPNTLMFPEQVSCNIRRR